MSEIGVGTQLGEYRVVALIGQGGMGTVYRAQHVETGAPVALKVLSETLGGDPDFRRRFIREARYTRELDHPNIVRVQEVDEADGRMYMVMPEIQGTDLKTLLALDGPMAPAQVVGILTEVAGALDALHERGILHRDVKPANVILSSGAGPQPRGRAYLTDFGLGKDPQKDSAALTAVGQFVGTFEYVAPEQVLGRDFDHRVDVYSLGCLLYECLTGQLPFPHEDEVKLLDAHVEDPPPRVTGVRPELPAEVDDVVACAMAKDPAKRYATATALAVALRAALPGVEPPTAPVARSGRAVAVRLEIDFGGRQATVALGENGSQVRVAERGGRWAMEPER